MEGGMLVGNFEFNSSKRPIWAWPDLMQTPKRDQFKIQTNKKYNTPNANMADHSVGAWNEVHESEASQASVDRSVHCLPLREKVNQCNSFRRKKGVHDRRGNY